MGTHVGKAVRRPNVLVPLTLGGATETKLAVVTQQARAFGARVTLLHVLDWAQPEPDAPAAAEMEAHSYLAVVQDELRREGVCAAADVRYGQVPATVSQLAEEQSATMIIVGASEPGALERRLVGGAGLAGAVSRVSRAPVLVVPRDRALAEAA